MQISHSLKSLTTSRTSLEFFCPLNFCPLNLLLSDRYWFTQVSNSSVTPDLQMYQFQKCLFSLECLMSHGTSCFHHYYWELSQCILFVVWWKRFPYCVLQSKIQYMRCFALWYLNSLIRTKIKPLIFRISPWTEFSAQHHLKLNAMGYDAGVLPTPLAWLCHKALSHQRYRYITNTSAVAEVIVLEVSAGGSMVQAPSGTFYH